MRDFDVPRSVIEHLIDEWVFSERDRAIMKRRLLDGLTYEELSGEFYLSPQRVKTIVKKEKCRIFRHL